MEFIEGERVCLLKQARKGIFETHTLDRVRKIGDVMVYVINGIPYMRDDIVPVEEGKKIADLTVNQGD